MTTLAAIPFVIAGIIAPIAIARAIARALPTIRALLAQDIED